MGSFKSFNLYMMFIFDYIENKIKEREKYFDLIKLKNTTIH